MAESLRLPTARFIVEAEPLEEGEQGLRSEHQLQPDLVGRELTEGEVAQPGVLAAADPVLDPGAATVARLELGQVGVVLIGDEHLETEPLEVSEGELGAGMRTFAPADGPGSRRPRFEVEVRQLADGGTFALLSRLGDGWHPGALRRGQNGIANGLGEVEA